jgi:hypothetical protein
MAAFPPLAGSGSAPHGTLCLRGQGFKIGQVGLQRLFSFMGFSFIIYGQARHLVLGLGQVQFPSQKSRPDEWRDIKTFVGAPPDNNFCAEQGYLLQWSSISGL